MLEVKKLTFEFALQADLGSLVETCLFSGLTPEECESIEQKASLIYGQIIVHSMRGEREELQRMIAALPDILAGHDDLREIDLACALRLMIVSNEFNLSVLNQTLRLLTLNESTETARRWRGELAMLLANVMFVRGELLKARENYQISKAAFVRNGFAQRALLAQTQALICEGKLNPGVGFLTRFHDLYRLALKGETRNASVATLCLLNMAKEYRRAGALLAALKHCSRAIALFQRQMGTVDYFEALNFRAELLTALGRTAEARIDLEMASVSPFKPVHFLRAPSANHAALGLPAGAATAVTDMPALVNATTAVSAQTKAAESQKGPKLSNLEEKLLSILSRGPRDRAELADEIYGLRLDTETKRNRFKSLIGTFRKKCPDLIIFDQGRYRIADRIFISRNPHVS